MIGPRNLFWDSCVFIRYLTEYPSTHVEDIRHFIEDTRARLESDRRKIFYSTIVMAEIRPRHLKSGDIDDFFRELGSSFEPIEPNPNILRAAGELRDAVATDPSTKEASKRAIGTADAIHLTTCLYVRDVLDVPDIVFHTLDEGKGGNWEGKCVPLLQFENWFPAGRRSRLVEDVCGLARTKPLHPVPRLDFRGAAPEPA